MPNWCSNSITISHHDKSVVDELESKIREGGDFFNILRPRPADQEENWYEWNVENWGTKWDVNIDVQNDAVTRFSDNSLSLWFDTAWSPPIAFYDYITELGWDVEAMYYEFGAGFLGRYSEGSDDYWEVDFSDGDNMQFLLDNLPRDLLDYSGLESEYEMHKEWQKEDGESNDIVE